jgi:hypothetical protein
VFAADDAISDAGHPAARQGGMMKRLTFSALFACFALAMAIIVTAGPASAASAPLLDPAAPAMTAIPGTVTIEPAGYYRPYYGPRYRYPRYGYPHYYQGYYYPRVWWGVPGPVYVPPRPAYGGHCAKWNNRCANRWGYRNRDYWGCMRYHGC